MLLTKSLSINGDVISHRLAQFRAMPKCHDGTDQRLQGGGTQREEKGGKIGPSDGSLTCFLHKTSINQPRLQSNVNLHGWK